MDNAKFEQLINLITNENEEQAKALFHDIVVQKSREIYESMMDEEGGMGQMGGQVGDLLDEINVEEEGISEEDDDLDDFGGEEDFGDEGEISLDGEADFGDEGGIEGEEGLEDRVVSLEYKLDELMAEFEELMADEEGEAEHNDGENDPDFGDEEGDGSIEGADDMGDEFGAEEEPPLAEAVALQNVKGLYGSKIGGDNGSNTRSIALTKPKVVSTGAKPVNVTGSPEAVPTAPKAPSNAYTKGETSVKGAGSFKNSPGQKKQDGEAAPKPTTSQASGTNNKSIVESRKRK